MGAFVHALETFFAQIAAVQLAPLGLALVCHLAKTVCRSRAWRNIVAAAYPDRDVRWRHLFGAYCAGAGVNALVPARGGDLVRLYLAKRKVAGSSYPTLASTFAVEVVFDAIATAALLVWVLQQGVLPGLDVLPHLPAFDLSWILDHPLAAAAAALPLVLFLGWLVWRGSRHVAALRRRIVQGFAVLGDRRLYLRSVATWQAADWCFRLLGLAFFLEAFGIGLSLGPVDTVRDALLVQVTESLSTLVPLTPSGIGTEQALLVYVFAGDVSTTALLSFSVGMKLVVVAVNVALGFAAIALMLGTVRWRRHMRHEQTARAATLPAPVPVRKSA